MNASRLLSLLRTGLVLGGLGLLPAGALTLEDLNSDPAMNPKRFASLFESFDYEYHPEVQWPNVFLAERRGDCDDYAILAEHVLKPKGFATRVIHVRLVGRVAHAVCYVAESKAYLDFNNRKYAMNLQRSGDTLRQIATKVASSFEANWTSVSEFTYDYEKGRKTLGRTVVKKEPPANDADARR